MIYDSSTIIDYVEISDSPTRSEVVFDFVFSEAKKTAIIVTGYFKQLLEAI